MQFWADNKQMQEVSGLKQNYLEWYGTGSQELKTWKWIIEMLHCYLTQFCMKNHVMPALIYCYSLAEWYLLSTVSEQNLHMILKANVTLLKNLVKW